MAHCVRNIEVWGGEWLDIVYVDVIDRVGLPWCWGATSDNNDFVDKVLERNSVMNQNPIGSGSG